MGDGIESRSELKSKFGEKRGGTQFGEKLERCKRVKMRDLDSVCRSEEMTGNERLLSFPDNKNSQEPLKDAATVLLGSSQAELTSRTQPSVNKPGFTSIDLNSEVHVPNISADVGQDLPSNKSKGFGWDLNADDNSNLLNEDSFYLFKSRDHLKSGDVSECGSTTGPIEDKDPMKVWKEMKQNGFLSSSHGGVTMPKPRGRKSKSDSQKKKMELAKKEQVDRFAKIAAPSGLLNELNPGIINHVRNRKQVHSIIEALVRLEKDENRQNIGKQAVSTSNCARDDNVNVLGMNQLGNFHGRSSSTLLMSQNTSGSLHYGYPSNIERRYFDRIPCPPLVKKDGDDDVFHLKLSSLTTMASEDVSSLSNEESANLGSASSLSVTAANIAFQWLELLQQDIKGRLAALRRSKKRVRSVISTELPFLMSREFSSSQENDPCVVKNLGDVCSLTTNADAHRAKWSALFDQMDKALTEEEKQLEIWLNQVKEMQVPCEQGLLQYRCHTLPGSQHPGTSETDFRLEEVNKSERELAVKAAAASIYSTCNYVSSTENLHCF